MGEQHDGDAEPACGAEDLARDRGVGLLLDLDEVGAAVAQQRLEGAPGVGRVGDVALGAHAAGGEREDLEPALALPGDVDGPAEPRLAPALRAGDGDLETASGEGAQFSPMGGLQVGVREDENSTQNGRHWTRTSDLRYVRPAL